MGGLSVLFGSLRIALVIDVIFVSLISVLSFGIRPEDILIHNKNNSVDNKIVTEIISNSIQIPSIEKIAYKRIDTSDSNNSNDINDNILMNNIINPVHSEEI